MGTGAGASKSFPALELLSSHTVQRASQLREVQVGCFSRKLLARKQLISETNFGLLLFSRAYVYVREESKTRARFPDSVDNPLRFLATSIFCLGARNYLDHAYCELLCVIMTRDSAILLEGRNTFTRSSSS